MTIYAAFRFIYATSSVHSPAGAWVVLGVLTAALLTLLTLAVLSSQPGKAAANFIAPVRAFLLIRRFPIEEQNRATATWQTLYFNGAFRGAERLLVAHLRDEQARGAFKSISARPPVPTSEIFSASNR